MPADSNLKPLPPALLSMVTLLEAGFPTLSVSEDVPDERPAEFIVVDIAGGSQSSTGLYGAPTYIIDVYGPSSSVETRCNEVLRHLVGAQFSSLGNTQWRGWNVVTWPHPFPDPRVHDRRRWQLIGTFGISNRKKG